MEAPFTENEIELTRENHEINFATLITQSKQNFKESRRISEEEEEAILLTE